MNANRKWIATSLLLLLCIVIAGVSGYCIVAYQKASRQSLFDANSIKFYHDIPGVTEEEIEAIEALKASRSRFVYGSERTTEAFVLPDGTPIGFTTLLCKLLSEIFDFPFVQEIHVWDSLKQGLDNKTIDFTGELTPTPERVLKYFMTYPIAKRSLGVFARRDSARIESEKDIKGLRIGFYEGTITAESILQVCPHLYFEIVDVYNVQDVKEKLLTGVIDVFIDDSVAGLSFEGKDFICYDNIFPLVHSPVSLTTANHDLVPIISVVDKYIISGGIDKLHSLYKEGNREYAKFDFYDSLTDAEKAYLNDLIVNDAEVPIALENDNYPICFYNSKEKKTQGIVPSILDEIAALTGMRFINKAEHDDAWNAILAKLATGKVAMVSELVRTEERKGRFLWSESPYAVTRYALISKANYPYLEAYQVVRTTVGVVSETDREAIYRKSFPNNDNVKIYERQSDVLDALEHGEIDLFMASEYELLFLTNYLEQPDYKVNIVFNSPLLESFFGFHKNEEQLRSIINKALHFIDTDRIEKSWADRTFNYEKKIAHERVRHANQIMLILSISAVSLFLLLIVMGVLWRRNLRTNATIVQQASLITAIYDSLPDIVFTNDVYGAYTSYNRSFEKFVESITERGAPEIVGKSALEIFTDDEYLVQRFTESNRKVIDENKGFSVEEQIVFPDGSKKIFELIKTPLIRHGKIISLLGIARDVTEQKMHINLLNTLNGIADILLHTEVAHFEDGLWAAMELMGRATNTQRVYIWKNHVIDDQLYFTQSYGWTQESKALRDSQFAKKTPYKKYLAGWEEILSNRDSINGIVREMSPVEQAVLLPQGTASLLMVPVFLNDQFWGAVGCDDCNHKRHFSNHEETIVRSGSLLIANALARHEATLDTHAAAKRLEAVIVNYPGIIAYIEKNGTIELFNGLYVDLLGIKSDQLIGSNVDDIKHDPLHSENIANVQKSFTEGVQEWVSDMNGWLFHGRSVPIFDDEKEIVAVVGNLDDITEMARLQKDLENAITEAQNANITKSNFLAKMSHEIRTPMNAIIGLSELALRTDKLDTVLEYARTVKQAGINLLAIINDILDFSKIEQNKLQLVSGDYAFSSLMNDVISIVRMRAMDSQIRFAVNLDSNIPDAMFGDETRIRQVLINLLGNAVKYTEKGFVSFSASGKIIDDNTVVLHMEVKDSGRGIKQEDIGRLFNDYYRVDLDHNKGVEGVGLGLAISLNIINAMDGEITVNSVYGQGSLFTVTLPQTIRTTEKLAQVNAPENKSVIIYERREIYADSIAYSLSNLGVRWTLAHTQPEFHKKIAEKSYSFIFISHALYDQNKDTIAQHEANAKVVLLTEFGETIPSGNVSILAMPIHVISIANVLNGESEKFSYNTGSNPMVRFTAPDATILLVDDISTNLKVAEGLLHPYRMQIDLRKSGRAAIEAVKHKRYDLVFMDHKMPEMDGIEATQLIRKMGNDDPYYSDVPIIALTANAVSGMREMFLENGFNDYLSKPIDTIKMDAILEQWLPKDKLKDGVLESQIIFDKQAQPLKAVIDIEGLDVKRGILQSGGTVPLFLRTLATFSEDAHERIKQIRECLATGNIFLYTTYVHALKSALANIGATKLSEMAKMLEMIGKRKDLNFITVNTDHFIASLGALLSRIDGALLSQSKNSEGHTAADDQRFKSELVKLKTALGTMDGNAINLAVEALQNMTLSDDEITAVRYILKNIMLVEYDEAIEQIEALLQRKR